MARTTRQVPRLHRITVEGMMRILGRAGFVVHPLLTMENQIEHPPLLRWERHQTYTIIQLLDDVGEQRYTTLCFSAEMPLNGALWDFWYNDRDSLPRDIPTIRLERRFTLAGGVTFRWLTEQIKRWDCDVFLQRMDVQSHCPAPYEETVH